MRGGLEAFDGEVLAHGKWNLTFAQHFQNVSVICWVANKCNSFMIFRRSANECDTTDIDIFDGICVSDVRLSDGGLNLIEIDRDEFIVLPAEVEELLVIFISGASEQATVDGRVEGLDSSTKDFGRLGVVGDFGDG